MNLVKKMFLGLIVCKLTVGFEAVRYMKYGIVWIVIRNGNGIWNLHLLLLYFLKICRGL